MKKTTPPKTIRKNGKGHDPVSIGLNPAVTQAILEDSVMEAVADAAALAATLEVASPERRGEVFIAAIAPQTPEEEEILELTGVPLLGPARARALADVGIRTLADLHAASSSQIGGVRGVGLRNAERIKGWLATQSPMAPGPPPLSIDSPPSLRPVAADESLDPRLAADNQDIADSLGVLEQRIDRLRRTIGNKSLLKTLARQLDKISSVAAELAEGPDTLPAKSLQLSVKMLKKIVEVLDKTAVENTLSAKKQDALAAQLRKLRKTLQKQVGD